jgi:hypothetical protein
MAHKLPHCITASTTKYKMRTAPFKLKPDIKFSPTIFTNRKEYIQGMNKK